MPGIEELLAGRTLVKRYRIEQVIGRGGFAAVYRAADERLGRPVAVKVITYPAPDQEMLEELRARFQREARAAASLPQHPNVVTVHDFGIDPELGLDFLVMEFLHGEDLATHLTRHGRPPLPAALSILRAATEGIAVGHRAGLVHRDVKPGNIFLAASHDEGAPRVCVLDFGIARVVEDEENLTRLTRGSTPHSPAYASPEQLRGEADLTPASDVFSLGVVGYQLLTGEKPFAPERRGDRAADSVPTREIREANAEVPPEVAAVIQRAMAPRPEDRFADAAALAEALDAATGAGERTVIAPAPVAAPPAEEDHTLLAPPPAAAPPPPAAPAPAPRVEQRPAPAPPRRGGPGRWVAAALLLLAVAGVALFALDGDEPNDGAAIDDMEAAGAGIPVGAAPQVVEDSDPDATAEPEVVVVPEGSAPVGSTPVTQGQQPAAGVSGAVPAPATGTPSVMPPGQQQRPVQQRPTQAQPLPQSPPVQQQPVRPAPRPDSQQAAPRDTTRPAPVLLGRPVQPRPATPPDTARQDSATGAAGAGGPVPAAARG